LYILLKSSDANRAESFVVRRTRQQDRSDAGEVPRFGVLISEDEEPVNVMTDDNEYVDIAYGLKTADNTSKSQNAIFDVP
jgi:hypothetical protein